MPYMGLNKVRITEADKTIVAEIGPVNSLPKAKPNLFYYWYSANLIHSTQGGFSGTLLNGQYNEYYLNKNLREQGTFKNGLKDGTWKTWNEDGTLDKAATWKNGVIVTGTPPSFWKKLNIFKKRAKLPADSSARTTP
jgi:antitoxin component YwqK of YwqJK toxin-antitoxin module